MTIADAMFLLLTLLVARAVFFRWSTDTVMHDPISALLATLPETLAVAAPEAAAVGAADAGLAAGAAGLGEAGLAAGGGLAEAAGGAGLAEAAGGAGLAAAEGGGLAAAGIGAELAGAALPGAEALTGAAGLAAPVSGASALTTAATPGLASIPTAAAPDFLSSAAELSPGFSASGDVFLPNAAQTAEGALTPVSFSGPAAGATPADSSIALGDFSARPPVADAGGVLGDFSPRDAASGGGMFSKARDFLKENKDLIGIGAAGASLLPMLFKDNSPGALNKAFPNLGAASGLAANTTATAEALQGASLNGVLPAGYEDKIALEKGAAEAKIRGAYGNLGQSGGTAEATDVANIGLAVDAERAKLLHELTTQGLTAANIAGSQNLDLAKLYMSEDDKLQEALSKFASNLLLTSLPSRVSSVTS